MTTEVDPLDATCPACLAAPGRPCIATSSDLPREHPHRLRGLAAAPRLNRCGKCAGGGWELSGRGPAAPVAIGCPVCAAEPFAACTESGTVRAAWHEVRARAAAGGVRPCGACDGIGWRPEELSDLRQLVPAVTTCGASDVGLIPGTTLGPCILRVDHEGPVHEDGNGVRWSLVDPVRGGVGRLSQENDQLERVRGYLDALIGNGCGATTPTLRVLRASLGPAGGSEETLDPQARRDLLWEIARAATDAGYYEDDPPRDGR